MNTNLTERVGNYVVTPLTQTTHNGQIEAAVSIRRGKYDRIFRFIELFDSPSVSVVCPMWAIRNFSITPPLLPR